MKTNEKRFEIKGAMHPDLGSIIAAHSELLPDGNCVIKIDTNKLNQAQQAKLSLALIKELANLSYDRLKASKIKEGAIAYDITEIMDNIQKLSAQTFEILGSILGEK